MKRGLACLCASLILLGGCDSALPEWLVGAPRVIKRTPGDRIDVVFSQSQVTPDSAVSEVPVEIPDQANLSEWPNLNVAMQTPHVGLTGIEHGQQATIGQGRKFSRAIGPAPIVVSGKVLAMDASGAVTAFKEDDLDTKFWTNEDGLTRGVNDALGGGLTADNGIVYVTTGNGGVRALSLADGKLKWSISVGAPVNGAPAVGSSIVALLTADNQTIALDAETGTTRWTHRGLREVASYFSTTAPVIQDGVVVSSYSSGEVFALRAESGSVMWSDTLGGTIKTRAAAVFNGIDADPIVQDGVVVVISASGEMQASALVNGRPLWQKRLGGHDTPWSSGNAMFLLSDTHDLTAVFKRDGSIRWATSLSVKDEQDKTKDITPALFGPIVAGNAVLVLDSKGTLAAYRPQDGKAIGTYELKEGAITAPIIVNGAMFYVTKDAKLHRYN